MHSRRQGNIRLILNKRVLQQNECREWESNHCLKKKILYFRFVFLVEELLYPSCLSKPNLYFGGAPVAQSVELWKVSDLNLELEDPIRIISIIKIMFSVPSLSWRTVLLDQLNTAVFAEIEEGMTILQVLSLICDRLMASVSCLILKTVTIHREETMEIVTQRPSNSRFEPATFQSQLQRSTNWFYWTLLIYSIKQID